MQETNELGNDLFGDQPTAYVDDQGNANMDIPKTFIEMV